MATTRCRHQRQRSFRAPSNLAESTLGAARIDEYKYRFIDQPEGRVGVKTTRTSPFLRTFASINSSARACQGWGHATVGAIPASLNSGAWCSFSRNLAKKSRASSIIFILPVGALSVVVRFPHPFS
jgi:hypothetical protein